MLEKFICIEDYDSEETDLSIQKMDFKETVDYILENATNEEVISFCRITKLNYKAWIRHNLEQSLADCTNEKLEEFLKSIKK